MNQKPKIQYVGQFYVYGSEARALELNQQTPKAAKKKADPVVQPEKLHVIHVDPVALIAIAVSFVMLASMIAGLQQLHSDWAEYQTVSGYVHQLRENNHTKTEAFRETYIRSDIRDKASTMGMIPKEEAERMVVTVTAPEIQPEPTWVDNVIWFMKGLFA